MSTVAELNALLAEREAELATSRAKASSAAADLAGGHPTAGSLKTAQRTAAAVRELEDQVRALQDALGTAAAAELQEAKRRQHDGITDLKLQALELSAQRGALLREVAERLQSLAETLAQVAALNQRIEAAALAYVTGAIENPDRQIDFVLLVKPRAQGRGIRDALLAAFQAALDGQPVGSAGVERVAGQLQRELADYLSAVDFHRHAA